MKHIIFDVGRVLVNWAPEEAIAQIDGSNEEKQLILTQMVKHDDWHELDRGTHDLDGLAVKVHARTSLPVERIKAYQQQLLKSLTPIQATSTLLERLKDQGQSIYILSNMSKDFTQYLLNRPTFNSGFNGAYWSYQHNLIKPEAQIFDHFLKTYDLNGEDCFFIDDRLDNIQMASQFGIQGFQLTEPEKQITHLQKSIHAFLQDLKFTLQQ